MEQQTRLNKPVIFKPRHYKRKMLFNGTKCGILPKNCTGKMGVNCYPNNKDLPHPFGCPYRNTKPACTDELPTIMTTHDLEPYQKLLLEVLGEAETEITSLFIKTTDLTSNGKINWSNAREEDRDNAISWVIRDDYIDPFSFRNICHELEYSIRKKRSWALSEYNKKKAEREAHYKLHGKSRTSQIREQIKKEIAIQGLT